MPPKTKSPKPKSSSNSNNHHHKSDGSYNSNSKTEEQWVDGPRLAKYHHHQLPSNGSNTSNGLTANNTSLQKNKSETWIDGPAASRVNQGNNFPSPKKSISRREPIPQIQHPPISSVKAQMIQQWISNQTHSSPFMDESNFSDSSGSINSTINTFFGSSGLAGYHHSSNSSGLTAAGVSNYFAHQSHPLPHKSSGNGLGNGIMTVEPEYKTLTVFKTCDDFDEDEECPSNGFEFEFIEVVEPEVPVPTRDACFQVIYCVVFFTL